MNLNEKTLARRSFKLLIHEADGQAFEDLFTSIMNYAEPEFQQIKPWGNIGDRKNDGYIRSKGIFFQVYAPEDIRKNYPEVIKKLENDFKGLLSQWTNIKEFYFVVNDKYRGINSDCELVIQSIQNEYKLKTCKFLTAKDLESTLFSLKDDEIAAIINNVPDPGTIQVLDYSILKEIIDYIMELPIETTSDTDIILPNFDKKIEFNNLQEDQKIINALNNGYYLVQQLEKYLALNSNFLADSLRDKMHSIYQLNEKSKTGRDLFWAIVNEASPQLKKKYQDSVIVIMAKYFETCDIFKEPPKD